MIAIGGIVPLTTVDFPERLAAVVFCQGCSWRCPYCHNQHLQPLRSAIPNQWTWPRLLALLQDRRGLLEGVVFSGGEPTLQRRLREAIEEVKGLGFLIGLHTSGMFPERVREILPLLDWVGLDIKAPLDHRYGRISGRPGSARLVRESLRLIRDSGVGYELRTTQDQYYLSDADVEDLQRDLMKEEVLPSIIRPARRV